MFNAVGWLRYADYLNIAEMRKFISLLDGPARIVVECPRVYPSAQQKGDQNDLIDLALTVGRMMEFGDTSEIVYPRQWKGTVDADVMTERIARTARLRGDIKHVRLPRAKSKQHNVWDAVGIGYWVFGLLNQKKIYRGGENAS
ncbi:MAG: hypothetical protein E6R03_17935 [Hyphomicrobiaceae bacterium]|nr:MAG: hypothetical protein E6R03_17935 [Hyphomicrobiaceae bacterium]